MRETYETVGSQVVRRQVLDAMVSTRMRGRLGSASLGESRVHE